MKQTMKRTIGLLMVIVLCLTSVPVPAYAEEVTVDMMETENSGQQESSEDIQEIDEIVDVADTESVSSENEDDQQNETNVTSEWDGTTKKKVFEGNGFKVTYKLQDSWNGGYNAIVQIENTGDITIENWTLGFDYQGGIASVWNAVLETSEKGKYVVKNAGWNQDIAAGQSVDFGINGEGDFAGFPNTYQMLGQISNLKSDDYSIDYKLSSDWGSGFNANITITNNTERALEDWVLEFDFDRNITDIWNATIDSHEGNHYVVKNAGYNANIATGKVISFGFTGNTGSKENVPDNIILYSYNINDDSDVEITINTYNLKKDNKFDYYHTTDKTTGLSGSLTKIQNVKSMSYRVKDLQNNVIEEGDITVSDVWENPNVKFTVGANVIEISAILKSGKKVEHTITIFNDRLDNLSPNLDLNDSDGDNLPNYVEQFFGTNCNSKDTDRDGLSDYDELYVLGSDPTIKDTDNNGIDDCDEDIDEDGLSALEEINIKTNPFIQDSDEDGLLDGEEINKYFTDPVNVDTDGDGVNDGKEVEINTIMVP